MGKNISIYGPALAAARENAGFTQAELAKELGISRVTLTGWENQVQIKADEKLQKALEKLLKVHIDVLTIVPHGTKKSGGDLADDPLVKSYVEQITMQKEMIEMLKKQLAECRAKK